MPDEVWHGGELRASSGLFGWEVRVQIGAERFAVQPWEPWRWYGGLEEALAALEQGLRAHEAADRLTGRGYQEEPL
jgi:hypothetical protein